MQMLEILFAVWAGFCVLSVVATIFSDDGKLSTIVEGIIWGTLVCCGINNGGTFAFVLGIVLASFMGLTALVNSIEGKPAMIVQLPMTVLLIIAVCKYTY